MAAPIVYRWDDGNAPVARGERRSLCDILHACLVTGYGSKPAAGWTREYVNATFDKAAFRNNPVTGTGFYLQVDGAGAAGANFNLVKAFEVMASVDSGLFPFKTSWLYENVGTSSAMGLTARPWVLIADDRAFYFVCWPFVTTAPADSVVQTVMLFFGDLVSRHALDPYGCAIGAAHAQTSFGPYMNNLTAANVGGSYIGIPRAISGVAAPVLAGLVRGGGPGSLTDPGGIDGLPYTAGDQILITRPYVSDGSAYSFRGWLPGYYYPCHPAAWGNLALVNADGQSYLSLRNMAYNKSSNVFISLDDWRA